MSTQANSPPPPSHGDFQGNSHLLRIIDKEGNHVDTPFREYRQLELSSDQLRSMSRAIVFAYRDPKKVDDAMKQTCTNKNGPSAWNGGAYQLHPHYERELRRLRAAKKPKE